MVNRLLKIYTKEEGTTDRDSFQFKRVDLTGTLLYDLFKEYRFQDYHHENNFEEKRDRIRKTYQEPGLKQALKEYGK